MAISDLMAKIRGRMTPRVELDMGVMGEENAEVFEEKFKDVLQTDRRKAVRAYTKAFSEWIEWAVKQRKAGKFD